MIPPEYLAHWEAEFAKNPPSPMSDERAIELRWLMGLDPR